MARSHDFRNVPIARTLLARTFGLLTHPPSASLFIPNCSSVHTFFMRHAIDLVFVDEANVVVTIVRDARPWRVFFGGKGAKSVLELPAATARQRELEVGDRLLVNVRE